MYDNLTRQAVSATLHCLTGCAIGEVLGMIIGTALAWPAWLAVLLAVFLAFAFGYSLSIWPLRRAGLTWPVAARTAVAADSVSIATMEIADNAFMLIVPGALAAGLSSMLFWVSLVTSLVVAFIVTVPINRWLIARGRGHALLHQFHDHHSQHGDHHA
ncbi:DUF4396 domain-containing protein [bacterium]|nr:MAG: DUF4396 domain-containing protein [bacterium]